MTKTTLDNNLLSLVKNFIESNFEFKNPQNKEKVVNEALEVTQALYDGVQESSVQDTSKLKEEIVERLKNELATKDFVRAEIAETKQELKVEIAQTKQELKLEIAGVRQELKQDIAELKFSMIKWLVGVGATSVVLAIGANFALIGFLVQNLKG